MTGTVHVVVPGTVDDPTRPSGGNVYDRHLCAELQRLGRDVRVHPVSGGWPHPSADDEVRLASVLEGVADGSTDGGAVLVDGLVASAAPALVSRYAGALQVVVLVHQPLGVVSPELRGPEGEVLRRVDGVVATSAWTRSWLAEHEDVPAERVRVAVPGASIAEVAPGSASGGVLLCVGAVVPEKGHDLLLDALDRVVGLDWQCTCVGSLDIDPVFAGAIRERAEQFGGRVALTGALGPDDVDAAYRAADVLVLPSRAETYGMVVTEALAHGLPAIVADVGGVPEALGTTPGEVLPGLLVPPDDATVLGAALRSWLEDPGLRARARTAARARRRQLPTWADAAAVVAEALESRRPPVSQRTS